MIRRPREAARRWRAALLVLAFGGVACGPEANAAEFQQEDRWRGEELSVFDGVEVFDLALDREGRPLAATAQGVYREETAAAEKGGRRWRRLSERPATLLRVAADGAIWFASGETLHELGATDEKPRRSLRSERGPIGDFAFTPRGILVLAPPLSREGTTIHTDEPPPPRRNLAFYGEDELGLAQPLDPPLRDLRAWSLDADAEGAIWIGAKEGLWRWSGRDAAATSVPAPGKELWLLGEVMQGLRAFADGSVAWGTDLGITIARKDGAMEGLRPDNDGLPMHLPTSFARESDGSLWAGSEIGAARRDRAGTWQYYQGPQWLPDDRVQAILCPGDGRVLLGTARGLGVIARRRMTWKEKAAHFDGIARQHHFNRHGFVWEVPLAAAGDMASAGEGGYTDNDGLWTAGYLASQCLRYAVTREPEARENARRAMGAILALEEVTGIPGYPARALARKDPSGSGRDLRSWYDAPDGVHVFKGDTSSDEIVGHYLAHALYWDHVAAEDEKPRLRRLVAEMTDHILSHGLTLVQRKDGEPTRWGIWHPEATGRWGHYWYSAGLWSLCILSHLKVAHHVTGLPRFDAEYRRLIREHDYARRTLRQKITIPGQVNHSDDQMAIFSFYPLLLYEEDPELRKLYLESLERSWQAESEEGSALWNLIASHFANTRRDEARTRRYFEDMPWLLIDWPHDNSRRWDLAPKPFLTGRVESLRALSMKEQGPYGFTHNPFRLRSGGDGRTALTPAIYLLPYWLGRQHRLIGSED